MRFGSLILVVALIYGCAPRAEKSPLSGNDYVRLERTPCFGSCPVYEVTIYGDGRTVFTGKMYVKVSGTVMSYASMDSVRSLFDEADRLSFFELKESYESKKINDSLTETVTDLPGRRFTVSREGKTKTVYDYYGGPDELRAFAEDIDAVAGVKKWLNR